MEIKGKVLQVMPIEGGMSQSGKEWKKQSFVLEYGDDRYSKKVCITIWGAMIDTQALKAGEEITAHIDVESREFNGRWYTEVRAWKIVKEQQTTEQERPLEEQAIPDNDLPF